MQLKNVATLALSESHKCVTSKMQEKTQKLGKNFVNCDHCCQWLSVLCVTMKPRGTWQKSL